MSIDPHLVAEPVSMVQSWIAGALGVFLLVGGPQWIARWWRRGRNAEAEALLDAARRHAREHRRRQ